MTCAACGRDLLVYSDELDQYAARCSWCAGRPARGILLAFVISSAIWWLAWRFAVWVVS
jgi:hypothetical protein